MPAIAFVGPLPPPVHGFSTVCAMMLDRLRSKFTVDIYDRSPKQTGALLANLRQLIKPVRYCAACMARRDAVLYLALSGGRGQFIDLGYVLLGRLFRRHIFIHHHSFAYINAPSLLNRLLFSLVRKDTHIVLSRRMGQCLTEVYGVERGGIRVVSNAAFDDATDDGREQPTEAGALRIGYLSNITFEKGFVEFFEVLQRLKTDGIEYRAYIAGPVSAAAETVFNKLLAESTGVHYAGPLYGDDKDRFYQQLDIFVFPTNYSNEAEPLVIYEAMRKGVFVIACERGAIAEMLANGAGLTFSARAIVESAVIHIANFSRDRHALFAAQQLSLQQAQRIRSAGRLELESILAGMHVI
jgi:glycosyltransferase involved in cell wall biosynthesis